MATCIEPVCRNLGLKLFAKLLGGHTHVPENSAQRAGGELAMERNDAADLPFRAGLLQDDMAAALPDFAEAETL